MFSKFLDSAIKKAMHPADQQIVQQGVLNKLEVLGEAGVINDDHCKTFVLNDEDHTLANSLRYMIMKNADVVFCAYTIPHPSEVKVNFRIQTNSQTTAIQALDKGLADLNQMCEHVLNVFEQEFAKFETTLPPVCSERMQM